MTKAAVLVVPGRLDSRTGGYIYDRHIVDGLRAMNWVVDCEDAGRQLSAAHAVRGDTSGGECLRLFQLAPSRSWTALRSERFRKSSNVTDRDSASWRWFICHLRLTVGLDEEAAARFANRRTACARSVASLVVVTGRATLSLLAGYDVPPSRVVVDRAWHESGARWREAQADRGSIAVVATLNPGKGHEDLITALAAVPSRDWQLTCAGSVTRHPTDARPAIQAIIRDCQLDDHVSLTGELDASALEACYDRSDLFVLATLRETYGMAVAEALAHGLPVVSTAPAQYPISLARDAGLLVSPGDVPALTTALSRVIDDARSPRTAGRRRTSRASLAAALGMAVARNGGRARIRPS